MTRVVLETEVTETKEEIKIHASNLGEEIEHLNKKINSTRETIEALKICANTIGGKKKIRQLSNLNFDTKILATINEIIEDTDIIEETSDCIIEEDK